MRIYEGKFACVFHVALMSLLLFILVGCGGGGGGGGDAPVTANLTVTHIDVAEGGAALAALAQPTLFIGHTFTVEVGVYSVEAASDVSVDFYIVDRVSFDTPGDDPEDGSKVEMTHYHIGSAFLGDLMAGVNIKTVELTLPYTTEDLDEKGNVVYGGLPLDTTLEYYLFAEVDPANLIKETNEEDNRPSEATLAQTMVTVSIEDTYMDIPNLILEDVLLEVPSFELQRPDHEPELNSCGDVIPLPAEQNIDNAHLGVTAVLNATGRYVSNGFPMPIPLVEVQAVLRTPDLLAPDLPVLLWDSAAQLYSDTLVIEQLETGTPTSISLELRIAETAIPLDTLVLELAQKMSSCASSCFLDRPCFIEEMIDPHGSCDQDVLLACGGSIGYLPPSTPFLNDPDWGCFIDQIDGTCINACEPDLECLYDCSQEFVRLEITVKAYDALGTEIPGAPPEFLLDDDLQIELVMFPAPNPPATGPVRYEAGFDKSFATKLLYAGLSANAYAGLDGEGASAGLEAALPVVLFKGAPSACNPDVEDCLLGYKSREIFLGVRSSLAVAPVLMNSNSMTTLDIYAFGQNLYPKFLGMACGVMSVDELSRWQLGGKDYCMQQCSATDKSCLRECGAFGKSTSIDKDFVVGVVPLTSSFEAWGLIGAMASLDLPDNCSDEDFIFEAQTGPWADLGTLLSAGVGNSKAFSVGIGGELDPLFADTFYATVAMNDLGYNLLDGSVWGTLHEDVTNALTGPEGRVFFYVGYPCIKVCRKWGVPYPCGFKQCKKKKTIAGFKTFEIEDVIFCEEQNFYSGPQ